jgi:translation initiation factor 1
MYPIPRSEAFQVKRDERPTVYSTDPKYTRPCKRCGRYPCRCPKPVSLPPERQTAAIRLERKGRGGKTVTVVMDLQLNTKDIKTLAKQLKRTCSTGGTVKDGAIEIQGDHREKVAGKLQSLGYKTKFVGG